MGASTNSTDLSSGRRPDHDDVKTSEAITRVPVLANAVGAPAAATVDAHWDVRRWPCRLVRRYVYYIPPSPYENKLGGIPTNPLLHLEPPLGQEPFIFEYGVVHTGPDTAPRGSCDLCDGATAYAYACM